MDGLRNFNSNEPEQERKGEEKKKNNGHRSGMKTQVSSFVTTQVCVETKTLKTHAMSQLPEEASCKVQSQKPVNKGNFPSEEVCKGFFLLFSL